MIPVSESTRTPIRFAPMPWTALLVVALWGLGSALQATAQVPDVLILKPKASETVFGKVEVEAEVLSAEDIAEVVIRVDGREITRLRKPPYRVTVDVGGDNVEHTFEVIAVSGSGLEGRALRTTPSITVDEELDLQLQQLYVTVTHGNDRVLHLGRDAFRVLDDGEPQEIVTFEPGDVPLTAAILVDASFSMKGNRLRLAVQGARRFVEDMKGLDEASLMLFSDRLLYSTGFTHNPEELTTALERVHAGGGTSIDDHLYLALKRLEAEQGRRVVILLTDGVDVDSALSMEDVLWMVGRSQTLMYWIRVPREDASGSYFTSWRNAEGHSRELAELEQAVVESGGRIVNIRSLDESEQVFREILRELREQYVIGYYPSQNVNDGRWHKVQVHVQGEVEYSVRTREGYIDF